MNSYYDVIQLTEANERPCEQIGVRYGDNLIVLRNFQDALTFMYCEKFFLKYARQWIGLEDESRLIDIENRWCEVDGIIRLLEEDQRRNDFEHIEKLLFDEAQERDWRFSIDIYDSILRLSERNL